MMTVMIDNGFWAKTGLLAVPGTCKALLEDTPALHLWSNKWPTKRITKQSGKLHRIG